MMITILLRFFFVSCPGQMPLGGDRINTHLIDNTH